jgi:hypothetical protein
MKSIKKTVFTLCVNNYAPEITAITFPLMRYYANKIGADFHIIKERKFMDWPIPYEKFQIYELAKEMQNDWNIFFDADALIHPLTPDWTVYLKKDTIAQHACDVASFRLRANEYFLRDGRFYGSAGWLTIASDWCLDLWYPAQMTPAEAEACCFPTDQEAHAGLKAEHLVDDYIMSCNVARFGLKTKKLTELRKEVGLADVPFHAHGFMMTNEKKVKLLTEIVEEQWKLPEVQKNYGRDVQ